MKRKNKNTIVLSRKKKMNTKTKLILCILLIIFLIFSIRNIVICQVANRNLAEMADSFYMSNAKTVFSIDKIILYSSANAIKNEVTRPVWDLNVYQYTDIAIYINNHSDEELNSENAIKTLYIDNIKLNGVKKGEQSLYFKNAPDFGKSIYSTVEKKEDADSNKIGDKLEFSVLNDGDINYEKRQIYADCSSPITLEYVNNIVNNKIISDIENDVKYDGSILKRSGIVLSDIKSSISFRINLTNNYNQKYMANVYIEIPLEDSVTGDNIYSGKFEKKIEEENYSKFYRLK
jgi:hypothetical protein